MTDPIAAKMHVIRRRQRSQTDNDNWQSSLAEIAPDSIFKERRAWALNSRRGQDDDLRLVPISDGLKE